MLCEADKLSSLCGVFLRCDETLYKKYRITGTYTCRTRRACVRAHTHQEKLAGTKAVERLARETVAKLSPEKKYFRGLYTGGTFAEETLMTFGALAPEIELHTNRDNTQYAKRLKTHKQSEKHTLLDMGDLDFTAEAPHTVFDPTQRVNRFKQELADPAVGLIAMDIILPRVARSPPRAMCRDEERTT